VGNCTVYQLVPSAASIADLLFLLLSCIAPQAHYVLDARETPSHHERHGQDFFCHQLGALRHHEEGGGEG
jgi:hypothetical protein